MKWKLAKLQFQGVYVSRNRLPYCSETEQESKVNEAFKALLFAREFEAQTFNLEYQLRFCFRKEFVH